MADLRRRGVSAVLALVLATAGCGGASPFDPVVVELPDTITAPTTLRSGHVYIVRGFFDVESPLTIEPGVVVKIAGNGDFWGHTGQVIARGTAERPIVFTSLEDDAWGGDTNGDGAVTAADPVRWHGMELGVTGSVLEHCKILYGGWTALSPALRITAPSTVRDSEIARGGGSDAVWIEPFADGTLFQRNVIHHHAVPLVLAASATLAGNTFHDPAPAPGDPAWPGTWPDYVKIPDGTVLEGRTDLDAMEIPVIAEGSVRVPFGNLVLGPGAALKFGGAGRLDLWSRVALQLGEGAAITSRFDQAHGGASEYLAQAGVPGPAAGDWAGAWDVAAAEWIVGAPFLYSTSSTP